MFVLAPHHRLVSADNVIRDGLTLRYIMNEGVGAALADDSGNGRTGSAEGGLIWTQSECAGRWTLQNDNVSTKYVLSPTHPYISANAFSICVFFKPTVTDNTERQIVSQDLFGGGDPTERVFQMRHRSSDGISIIRFNASNAVVESTHTGVQADPTACRLYTFTFTTAKGSTFYLDDTVIGDWTNKTPNHVGGAFAGVTAFNGLNSFKGPHPNLFAPGFMYDLRIYDRALSAAEVAQIAAHAG